VTDSLYSYLLFLSCNFWHPQCTS